MKYAATGSCPARSLVPPTPGPRSRPQVLLWEITAAFYLQSLLMLPGFFSGLKEEMVAGNSDIVIL